MTDWREVVYHASQFPWDSREYWDRVEEYIIDRDGHRCQACRKSRRVKAFTVHHILPRADGGEDNPDNLITLCNLCHDYVEAIGLRTRAEIVNCTRFMDKVELQQAILLDDADILPTTTDQTMNVDEEPTDEDRAEIICSCGIYHIRKASQVGERVKEIRCLCGRVGIYNEGEWTWGKPKPKQFPARVIKPYIKRRKPETHRTKPNYSIGSIQCPLCLKAHDYYKNTGKLITCECGNQAMRVQGVDEIEWVWFGRVKLVRKIYGIRV